MRTYTEADFEMAFKLNTRLCYAFGVSFLIAAIADALFGTDIFNWLFAHFGG